MKRIYSAPNITLVSLVLNMLEDQGINCLIKNKHLSGAAGELPPIECWPQLWLFDDSQYDKATKLVSEITGKTTESTTPWTCPGCREIIEGQFTECWNCGTSHP